MTVFVTGATGFVGREIVRQLHGAGHSMRILVRDPGSESARDLASKFGAQAQTSDLLDSPPISASMNGADAVIHLVGIISEVGQTTFENVHLRGTQHVVAAARQAGVNRLIHMSALGTRPNARSRYHQTKWAAEELVRSSGLDYTIFRPSLIYGPADHFVNLFAEISRLSPVVPIVGSGRTHFQPVSVGAVATAFVRALSEPRSIGQTYDLCGPETLTLPEIITEILAATRRRRLTPRVPLPVARLQASVMEFIYPRLLGQAPPLNRDQLLMLEKENLGNPQPADDLFALRHPTFREGISRYLTRQSRKP